MPPSKTDFRSTAYQYAPLERPDSIRLLRIEDPLCDRWDDVDFVPWCRMEHFTLSDAPPYRALSYAWGSPKMRHIFLNGRKINIRRNLWQALWHLRWMGFHGSSPKSDSSNRSRSSLRSLDSESTWMETGPVWIWIDALCIDQQNVTERNHQVRFMGNIYKMAEEVFVWLGWVEQKTRATTARGEEIWVEGQDIYNALSDIRELTLSPNNGSTLVQNLTSGASISGFLGLLTDLAYWRRMWIVQEIGLASKIHVLFGKAIANWECFQELRDILQGPDMQNELANHPRFAIEINGLRKCQAFVLDSHRRSAKRNGLADWIESCQACNCHDPKDKIYALVGLAQDCQNTNESDPDLLKIDYSRSLFEVYSDTIKFYEATKRSRRGPSQHVIRFSQVLQQSLNRPEEIESGAEEYFSRQVDFGNNLTHVFGLIGGTIDRVGIAFGSNELFKSLCSEPPDFPHCSRTRSHVLGDMYKIVPTSSQTSFAVQASEASQETLLSNLSRIIPGKRIPEQSPPASEKCVPILLDNDLTGYAPSNVLPGDFICQSLGCDVAAVLRQREGGFDIVGRALIAKTLAEREDNNAMPWSQKYTYSVPDYTASFSWQPGRAIYLYLDIVTLQQLTV
ncbi:Heterokaryon incompatibility protein 6 OR allele [Lachnellula suecica]|uniref:Heterokaryon incompatibility protein 6 OR allele n=1 Tax=Lachnellula suecica TaxID=602035 RepID=A0A8T9CCJ9_9HELO|nr:Heterokaryon incompatibility protein 6 OR allele [Lachnellula suecica]